MKRSAENPSDATKRQKQDTQEQRLEGSERGEASGSGDRNLQNVLQYPGEFGLPSRRKGQESSTEGTHTQEEHRKIVEYAREALGLKVNSDNTSKEILDAVNQQRKEMGKGRIKQEGLQRRSDGYARYKDDEYHLPPSSSEGEEFDDTIDHVRNLRPQQMSNEQKGIYAESYNIEVSQVENHWNSTHEKRVHYANEHGYDVTPDNSPSDILNKVNAERIGGRITLEELDKKAAKFNELGDKYDSSEDERVRLDALQKINTLSLRTDALNPRNSETWKAAQDEYNSRGGQNTSNDGSGQRS